VALIHALNEKSEKYRKTSFFICADYIKDKKVIPQLVMSAL
jgi:hypothetical protein